MAGINAVIRCFVAASLGLTVAAAPAPTPRAREAFAKADGHALQADMPAALRTLRSVPESEFSPAGIDLRSCILNRFGATVIDPPIRDLPPTVSAAIALYRSYWRTSLLRPDARETEEQRLRQGLASLLGLAADTDMSRIETLLGERLRAEDFHALTGRTPPLRELMLWRTERSEIRDVALPEGRHRVRVVLLDGFVSMGWSAYATCDRRLSAGWVRPDGIYAVVPGWRDLDGEPFLVSFLGHETQHFADRARYGELPSWELEYRAKLAELAMADQTLPRLIAAFASNQSDDMDNPHSYANRRVLAALRSHLGVAPGGSLDAAVPAALRNAAVAALRADSARRQLRGD